MSIDIMLVDDHPVVRKGLKSSLEGVPGLRIIGEAGNGREAIRLVSEIQADIVIMDLQMPELNGIEATRQIRTAVDAPRVICLSMYQESRFVSEMFRAGASGYVLKNEAVAELPGAIRIVMAGGVYLSPRLTFSEAPSTPSVSAIPSKAFTGLSPREREILQLLAEGATTKEIASRLEVSTRTVSTHREHIMEKLNLHNVADLTRYAIREGIAHP